MAHFKMLHITEADVLKLLKWEEIFKVIEIAMRGVTEGRVVQNPRSITRIPNTENILFSMPGFIDSGITMTSLACKLVTQFPKNLDKGLPMVLANILLFDEENGTLQAVIEGTTITAWRTAAASAVATEYLMKNKPKRDVLAVIGTGVQAKSHVLAFQHFFNFKKVNIWGKTPLRRQALTEFLQQQNIGEIEQFSDLESSVRDADVIITTTFTKEPLIKYNWLKGGYHICAVGHGNDIMELDLDTYQNADVFIDHLLGVENELKHLTKLGVVFKGELGALINGTVEAPPVGQNTIFQSLGMAVEDCTVAKLIYCKYLAGENKS